MAIKNSSSMKYFRIFAGLLLVATMVSPSQGSSQSLRRRLQDNSCRGGCREPRISSVDATDFVQQKGGTVDEADQSITLQTNDWVTYDVTVPSDGMYLLQTELSSENGSSLIMVDPKTAKQHAKITGNPTTANSIVSLRSGTQQMRLFAEKGPIRVKALHVDIIDSMEENVEHDPSLMRAADQYSSMEGVTVQEESEGPLSSINLSDPNSWVQYNFQIPSKGEYQLDLSVSNKEGNGPLEVVDGDNGELYAEFDMSNVAANDERKGETLSKTVAMDEGLKNLRVRTREGGAQITALRLSLPQKNEGDDGDNDETESSDEILEPSAVSINGNEESSTADVSPPSNEDEDDLSDPSTNANTPSVPNSPMQQNQPAIVMMTASSYTSMNGIELDTETPHGLPSTTPLDANDSITYSVTIPKAGKYEMQMRVSSSTGGAFEIVDEVSGKQYATFDTLPITGDEPDGETISAEVDLPSGPQKLKVNVKEGGWSYSWIRLTELMDSGSTESNGLSADPVQSDTEGGAPATISGQAQPATPADPAKPATPAGQAQPATPADPAKPATPAGQASPATPADPAKPATPAGQAQPATPADPANPATPAGQAQPATPADPAKPATPAGQAQPATPADPAKPATPATSGGQSASGAESSTAAPDPLLAKCDVAIEAAKYSKMSGIQVQGSTESMDNIGWLDPGDWVEYSVSIPSAGSYSMGFRIASPEGSGGFDVLNNGAPLTSIPSLPKTSGWQDWKTVPSTVSLSSGSMTLRINMLNGGFNLVWICLTRA